MARGAQAQAIIGGVRDLTAADLLPGRSSTGLQEGRSPIGLQESQATFAGLERLRALHHRIARTLAGFEGNVAAAAAVLGLDPERIRNLQSNPTFVELVAFYRDRGDEVVADLRARMELLAYDALSELHERLIGDPEQSLTNREVMDMMRELLDRLGHGPVQKGVVASVNLTPQELGELMGGAGRVKVVEDVREGAEGSGEGSPSRAKPELVHTPDRAKVHAAHSANASDRAHDREAAVAKKSPEGDLGDEVP